MMAWLRVPRASVGVGVVGVLAGLIVAANAAGAGDDPERAATDLVSLARAQTGRLEDLQDENATIRSQIAPYLDAHDDDPQAADESVQAAAGSLPVSGPGIEVSLTDAPVPDGGIPADRVPDDYVVHQQDVESVINALRTGGAEALTIQGERVVSTTPSGASATCCTSAGACTRRRSWSARSATRTSSRRRSTAPSPSRSTGSGSTSSG
jgi:uncharacterized protein YlxW (UPF0749 family)